MNEADCKAAALSYIRGTYGHGREPIVTLEFSLGSSGTRADLAVLGDKLIGFEIKTAKDTLRRLRSQMASYFSYFNEVVVIVARCHVKNITSTCLGRASLLTYDDDGRLETLKSGENNIVHNDALNDVMTQAERRKGNFLTAMENRYGRTSERFWTAVTGREIEIDDLPLLSRFAELRERERRLVNEQKNQWSQWIAAQEGA